MKIIQLFALLLIFLINISCSKEDNEVVLSYVSVESSINSASESGTQGAFIFKMTTTLTTGVKINFEITGSATNGVDYEMISNTISIPANQLSVTLPINAYPDDLVEGDENILITISSLSNQSVSIDAENEAELIILDAPPPLLLDPSETKSYMVNPNATDETVALFYHLKTLSASSFIVGQQDAFNSFFKNIAGESDMKKTTGSDPGLLGSDFMFITDNENDETANNWFFQQEQIIKSDVIEAYNKGMVNIFSWHLREPYEGKEFYTANMTNFQKTNAFKSILPGGENHEYYKQKLDKVAQVALSMFGNDGQLIPIIFRPFHEFDGDWFWWGKSYCTPEEYITVWKFTVDYLTITKNVNNMLFAYSPDKNFDTPSGYLSRYPGDDYVDILGMDNYGNFNEGMMGLEMANSKLKVVSDLAREKVKIAALTESCFFVTPGENSPIENFYSKDLFNALTQNNVQLAFMMFWYNVQDTYCVPPPNQEGAIDFINFASKPETLLSRDLPDMYTLPNS